MGADEDGSGSLDHGEIRALALSLGVTDEEELAKALEQMDSDGDGDVTQEEFVKWWCAQVDEKADGKKPGFFSRLRKRGNRQRAKEKYSAQEQEESSTGKILPTVSKLTVAQAEP